MKRLLAILALLAVSACGGSGAKAPTAPPKHTLMGDITVHDTNIPGADLGSADGEACQPGGGYADIRPDAQVVVKDGDGKLLAVGSLASGYRASLFHCKYAVAVPDVPEVPFYAVEVSHRGVQNYSLASMREAAWQIHLELG